MLRGERETEDGWGHERAHGDGTVPYEGVGSRVKGWGRGPGHRSLTLIICRKGTIRTGIRRIV